MSLNLHFVHRETGAITPFPFQTPTDLTTLVMATSNREHQTALLAAYLIGTRAPREERAARMARINQLLDTPTLELTFW